MMTIVLPAFNEERRLPSTLESLLRWAENAPFAVDIIVSDDGSSDLTVDIATAQASVNPILSVLEASENLGKGAALKSGFGRARGDLVLFLDADLPIPVSTIGELITSLGDADILVGSRRADGADITSAQPTVRRFGGRVFLAIVAAMGFGGTSDPQCGVKLLRASSTAATVEQCVAQRFAFDIELIARARLGGLTVVDHPVAWRHVDGSTLRPLRDGIATLRDLAHLRRQLAGAADPTVR